MGFFTRKESTSQRRPVGRTRPSVSSEAQAAELRVRARRRLAGAVAIVLCAIIVLPMLLDSEPVKIPSNIEVSIPSRNSPFNPVLTPPAAQVEGSAIITSPSTNSGLQPAGQAVVKPAGSGQSDVILQTIIIGCMVLETRIFLTVCLSSLLSPGPPQGRGQGS